jgi:hypothetical protein
VRIPQAKQSAAKRSGALRKRRGSSCVMLRCAPLIGVLAADVSVVTEAVVVLSGAASTFECSIIFLLL